MRRSRILSRNRLTDGIALTVLLAVACGNQSGPSALNSPLNVSDDSTVVLDTGPGPSPIVEPDLDYQAELERARFEDRGWCTDFSCHTVAFKEILSGCVGRDGIPPLVRPQFESIADAESAMNSLEPVVVVNVNGEARAYPLAIWTWHEVVNDVVGGEPIIVTFCPLCNSALAFNRMLEGWVFDFGVSGNLRNSNLIMWDRQTQTWWQRLTGEGIIGELAGHQLPFIPVSIISWDDFKSANPDGLVPSRNTGFYRPYRGYDRVDRPPFLFGGDLDGRLLPEERVAGIDIGDTSAAFPFSVLETERVVNYSVNGTDVVVFFKPGAVSTLDRALIIDSNDVGSTGVFDANMDGRKLTFSFRNGEFVDDQTGTVWSMLGEGLEGEMAGKSLIPIVRGNHFWFAWGAFKPDTLIYQGSG